MINIRAMTLPTNMSPIRLDLDQSPLVLLTVLGNRLTATGSATYRRKFGLGIVEFRLLAALAAEPGISGRRIGEMAGMDNGAVSRSLRSLQSAGLVCRESAKNNRAYHQWRLTEAGQEAHDRAVTAAVERDRILLVDLTPAERNMLVDMIRRMLARVPDLSELSEEDG